MLFSFPFFRIVGPNVKKLPKMKLADLQSCKIRKYGENWVQGEKVENKGRWADFAVHLPVKFYCCLEKPPEGEVHVKPTDRASLVVQWLRVRLPMQGTRVRALVWEDPTCRGATRPVSHNY